MRPLEGEKKSKNSRVNKSRINFPKYQRCYDLHPRSEYQFNDDADDGDDNRMLKDREKHKKKKAKKKAKKRNKKLKKALKGISAERIALILGSDSKQQ